MQNHIENRKVTFYHNTRYAGGRSHRNINTVEFVDGKDIFEAAQHYGYNMYPAESGLDFDHGVFDESGREIMDAEDYLRYNEVGVGVIDFGETQFYAKYLKDIDAEEFRSLPPCLRLDYLQIWNPDITNELFLVATENYRLEEIFDFMPQDWEAVDEMHKTKTIARIPNIAL